MVPEQNEELTLPQTAFDGGCRKFAGHSAVQTIRVRGTSLVQAFVPIWFAAGQLFPLLVLTDGDLP